MQKTKKRRLIAQHEFVLLPEYQETPVGVSMTVPDESMSIREILQKHVSGLNIVGQLTREATYGDDPDFDDLDLEKFRDSDMFERSETVRMNKKKVEDLTQKVKANAKTQKTVGESADRKGAAEHSDETTKESKSNARQTPEKGGEKPTAS